MHHSVLVHGRQFVNMQKDNEGKMRLGHRGKSTRSHVRRHDGDSTLLKNPRRRGRHDLTS